MGVILMRVSTRCGSLTSGVFHRLMAKAFPEVDTDSRVGAGGGATAARSRALGSVRGCGTGRDARAARDLD